jgi:hypothetical protein
MEHQRAEGEREVWSSASKQVFIDLCDSLTSLILSDIFSSLRIFSSKDPKQQYMPNLAGCCSESDNYIFKFIWFSILNGNKYANTANVYQLGLSLIMITTKDQLILNWLY